MSLFHVCVINCSNCQNLPKMLLQLSWEIRNTLGEPLGGDSSLGTRRHWELPAAGSELLLLATLVLWVKSKFHFRA